MLGRAALRAIWRSSYAGQRVAVGRTFSSDMSPTLETPKHGPIPVADFERFDPTKWLSEETDPAVRSELARIRASEDEAIAALTEEVPDIDWDAWRKEISYPGIVDEMKAAHDSVPVPEFDAERERMQKAIHDAFGPMLASLKKQAEEAAASSKVYEERLAEITRLHDGLAEMPVDEFLDKYPGVRKSIEDDLMNNKWFV